MPTPTYTPLANITLGSAQSSVTFSSLPSTYRDLVIVFQTAGSGDENLTFTVNGSTSDFSWVQMTSGPGSSSGTNNSIGRISTDRTMGLVNFMDYSATDKHKTFLVRTNVTGSEVRQLAARWAQTSAITSIGLGIRTGFNFASGSTFAIYGIAA